MNMKHDNGGFTLVEFVVTIAVASMITLAATSMLLLGLRIHHTSNATAGQLNTVSMLYSVMDTIASETYIKVDESANPSWTITSGDIDDEGKIIENTTIQYNADQKSILLNETSFVNDISSSTVTKSDNLITIKIATDHDEYTFSIYCRKGVT